MKKQIDLDLVYRQPIEALKQRFDVIQDGSSISLKGFDKVIISMHYGGYTKDLSDMSYKISTYNANVRSQRIRVLKALNHPEKFIEKVRAYQEKTDGIINAQKQDLVLRSKKLEEAKGSLSRLGFTGFHVTHLRKMGQFKAEGDSFSFLFTVNDGFVYPSSLTVHTLGKISTHRLYHLIDHVKHIENGSTTVLDGAQNQKGERK